MDLISGLILPFVACVALGELPPVCGECSFSWSAFSQWQHPASLQELPWPGGVMFFFFYVAIIDGIIDTTELCDPETPVHGPISKTGES